MSTKSISRRDELNKILKDLTKFYSSENQLLLELLVEKKVPVTEIAKKLNVFPNAINVRLNKGGTK